MLKRVGPWIFAGFFLVSGILHLAVPATYARIVPPMFPRPRLLVLISGGAELLGGVGLLVPRFRRAAAFGLAILLVAIFPANIYMAVAHVPSEGLLGNRWLQWLRLPIQLPLIWWAWQYTRSDAQRAQRQLSLALTRPRISSGSSDKTLIRLRSRLPASNHIHVG
jgi:uncharacterized membrane protein